MGKKSSWVHKFFVTENTVVKDKKTQIEQNVLYDVCKLSLMAGSPQPCVAFYKHNLANGIKNLQNHLINKHSFIEEVEGEIVAHHPSKSIVTLFFFM